MQQVDGILSQDYVDIHISNITFAFNNHKVLSLLQKRGTMITNNNMKDIKNVEEEVD